MKISLPRCILYAGAIHCIPLLVTAQQADSTKQLQEVVVTGQYKPQSLKNSVYQVRVINNERIRLRGANNVLQVLNNELGFRLSNDAILGTDVSMMGMAGRNIKILLDGVPIVDRNDQRESLSQIDINTIDRIEIVEGPMSVSYGSDALAGVINVITKKPGKELLTVSARVQEETAGNEYHAFNYRGVHQQSLNIGWQKKEWSISGGGAHIDANGFGGDEYGRNKTLWKPKEQWLGNIRAGYTSDKFNIYYRLDGLDETIVSRGKIGQNYKAFDQRFISNRYLHQVQAAWRISEKLQFSSILSYTDYKRTTKSVNHDFITGAETPGTGVGEQDVAKFNSTVFRTTAQYKISDRVSLQPGIDINREEASGQRITGSPVITDYALFVSSEIKAASKISIRPGVRFIKNSQYDAPPAVPSINAKMALSKHLDLRLAYAYGFRAPALRELYWEFIDANHNIVGNPNLKAEYSNNFNGSLTWSGNASANTRFSSTLGGFYNQFKDMIGLALDANNSSLYVTTNIGDFKTAGGTWENKIQWKNLQASLGFAYIGRYNSLNDDPAFKNEDLPSFVWSPEINTNIIYNWSKPGVTLSLFYKFTGKQPGYQSANVNGQNVVQLTKVADYSWADFTVNKSICKWFTLSAGVKNIFDVTTINSTASTGSAHTGAGTMAMSYGRSYFAGLNFQWSKK